MPLDEPETLHEVGSDFDEFLSLIKPYEETEKMATKATGGVFLAAK